MHPFKLYYINLSKWWRRKKLL